MWCLCKKQGTCIGCHIENLVQKHYGTQGLDFLKENLIDYKRDEEKLMPVSKGVILSISGDAAKKLMHDLDNPIVDEEYLKQCKETMSKFVGTINSDGLMKKFYEEEKNK